MRASRITINPIINDYTKGKNNINVSLTETTRGKKLNLPDGPNNGGVNWAKPPYSGTGLTQGMGIDMYILDENLYTLKMEILSEFMIRMEILSVL